ncbi:protein-disulfide reductase DsbD domain-containing protein [Moritella sp.]|uniref:protein-disulfide reductase DsbD family protein n=1 Tax=Moritella sp. TaxID=78556 RepID=UPI001E07D6DA|nr:protein-disulfide reductase DsbD domain-containing protein [Moritella sp.]MCJ8351058.1 thioredoxin family protein [Moritella sp.]NQZ41136.1 thioredoxin family protein [Moritella sp.]
MRFYILICLLLSSFVYAEQSATAFDPAATVASAQLLSTANGVNGATILSMGLKITLDDEWKTYWSSPGLAGAPPSIDWQGSENLAGVEWLWPVPQRMMVYDVETYGYKHEVIYPLQVSIIDPSKALALQAKTTMLVCREVCIRAQVDLVLNLPATASSIDKASSAQLQPYVANVPVDISATSASIQQFGWDSASSQLLIEVAGLTTPVLDGFVEGVDFTLFSQPQISQQDGVTRLIIRVEDMAGTPARLDPQQALKVTLTNAHGGITFTDTIKPTVIEQTLPSWIYMLLLAVVGGLILNLMPCVLPVLSIKLLGVVESVSESSAQRRVNFLLSAAGIFVAFWLLALLFIGLKYFGIGFGWGVQFQSATFLLIMIPVLLLFALNLLDKFDVQLPQSLMDRLSGSNKGHFYQGIFAVLLATPCSAPFLGTAVAFALAGSSWQIMVIFSGLALGLSLPYLLIAMWPNSVNVMPKPGLWMVRFRQFLAALLCATLVWLIWLLQAHLSMMLWVVFSIIICAMVILLIVKPGPKSLVTTLALYLLLANTIIWSPESETLLQRNDIQSGSEIHWQVFEPEKIAGYVAEGKTVFIDITADWCITCVVNERAVLQRSDIIARLNADNVVAMKGDWTKPDSQIEAYLKRHGRYAIPFNQVFGPALPQGKLLPELLTKDAVTIALVQAGQ